LAVLPLLLLNVELLRGKPIAAPEEDGEGSIMALPRIAATAAANGDDDETSPSLSSG
jgi:hypothetical protein